MAETEPKLLGLTAREAHRRLVKNGYNEVIAQRRFASVLALLSRFKNPLVVILVLAALLSGFLGDTTSAIIIISIVLISTILDFINTYKSDKAAEALKSRVRVNAAVYRSGQLAEVPVRTLVVGDVVALRAGDIIPGDGKVLEGEHFFVNESALTGESFPKPKQPGEALYMGSSTVSGMAHMLVTATGRNTKFSKIATAVERELPTEFDREIKDFSLLIIRITFGLVLFVFLVNALLKHNLLDSLLFSLALAVGLTPELLPMIITLNLTKGSLAMARRGVIVKKLSAIENFGSMDILCTDKTGTLTEDRIEVVRYVDPFGHESESVLQYAYVGSAFETGFKSPLDAAVMAFRHIAIDQFQKLSETPFDFERKRSAVLVKHGNERLLIVRGAPEEVLKVCSAYGESARPFDDTSRRKVLKEFESLSQEGFRVLGVARRSMAGGSRLDVNDEADMTMLGFVAFLDPAKKTVAETLRHMRENGIEIKILTGDNDLVTQKIATDIHLNVRGVLTGAELEGMSNDELVAKLEHTTIFARVNPEQKLRIITLLQKAGHVVGYMGDGINDAPSLKAADTGISVNNAVDIAKDTADFILMHKSLADLIEGVKEGRRTFANTLKYLKMALSSNFGNMFSMAGASVLLPFLPMLAPQILLNNLLYDSSQLTIPLDNVDREEITQPHLLKIAALKKFMWVFGPLSSLFDFVTFFVLYSALHLTVGQFQAGWFIESIATQVLVIWVLRTRRLPLIESRPSLPVALASIAAIGVACLIVFSGLGHYLKFVPLPGAASGAIAAIVGLYILAVQLCKVRFYRWISL